MKKIKKKENLFTYIFCAIIVLIVFFITFILGMQRMEISGNSMYPNLYNKEMALSFQPIWMQNKEYKRGDIIAFKADNVDPHVKIQYPGKKNVDYVKRIIGIPGDTIVFKDNILYINGKEVNQNFISKKEATTMTEIQNKPENIQNWDLDFLSKTMIYWNEYSKKNTINNKIPKGCYFVMGDNRGVSWDSRYFGYVPQSQILGKIYEFNTSKQNKKIINNYQLTFKNNETTKNTSL